MMSFATSMLSQADGALAGASDSLQTARELMVSAGNGTLQAEDRKSIAVTRCSSQSRARSSPRRRSTASVQR